ncbi:hypothetical protein LbDm2_2259 [Levilactobacillus brevis]|uniref:hypothetical protein n=1 Tax=Levilactobacillus brevis TaxID=1580 RepID=UPI00057C8C1C|nr:hypothetical protein [Levilactobacillus brevis]KID42851.1 hypothetical protein LbDm2_2259 [Levilactobacillus brevis]
MTKKMGHVSAMVANALNRYALGRDGGQITIVDREIGEAFVLKLSGKKADIVWQVLISTHPNRDIGKIEFDTKKGPRTIDELIKTGPDGTLKSKLGLI